MLETKDKTFYHFKTDILKHEISYSSQKGQVADLVTLTPERVEEVAAMNAKGIKPERLQGSDYEVKIERSAYGDLVGQDSISRFDTAKKKKKKKNRNKAQGQPAPDQRQPQQGGDKRRQARGRVKENRSRDNSQPVQFTGLKEFRPRRQEGQPMIDNN